MRIVEVSLPNQSYQVRISNGLIAELGELVSQCAPAQRCAVFGDKVVAELYQETVVASLASRGYEVFTHSRALGETDKTLASVREFYDVLLDARLERKSPVVALGGGVTGDSIGFVASTYLRGVPLIQVPTTLLAMVDASVGGKVAVNVPQGKNLIGCFYQPRLVAIDPGVLSSLPKAELRSGLAECIKHAVIRDANLFEWTERNSKNLLELQTQAIEELLERNISIKASVVAEDEREQGVRAHLNFGHTFAHAIEKTAGYGAVLHGEAVGLGMLAATRLAVVLGLCEQSVFDGIHRLLCSVGLPTKHELVDDASLVDAMRLDKKVSEGDIKFVLPTTLGEVLVRGGISETDISQAWAAVRA
jgi:3-dehydroquinate synthase